MPVVPLGGDSFFQAGCDKVGIWRAEDVRWTVRHVDHAESLRMAVLCGGSLYVLDTNGYVLKIGLPSLHATEVAAPSLRDKYHMDLAGALEKGYLVEAYGEVLFVWPLFTTRRVGHGGDAYRVEEDQLAGDVALFVSRWSSLSVRASEKGCVSNCVYFVCDEGAGNTWGAFSLGERRMVFEHAIGAASYKERLWFYPTAQKNHGWQHIYGGSDHLDLYSQASHCQDLRVEESMLPNSPGPTVAYIVVV
ncbi:hypothetical protein BAE44_0007729 [Dichanthelium oligosanthes]|uniref:KIB1-4 beta-propeller domain-containing protein n=1 Tax=Dichanthelium oligosanthes TaxID=888268 RepID=A0A1E5W1N9_9POAL|nr:hypothetical protein BAE44_0007729 [Dichanthelium oligosanthes]